MNELHEALLARTKRGVDTLFSDRSVALETTVESLKDLREHIDMMLESLENSE
jgi:hypothetical protein